MDTNKNENNPVELNPSPTPIPQVKKPISATKIVLIVLAILVILVLCICAILSAITFIAISPNRNASIVHIASNPDERVLDSFNTMAYESMVQLSHVSKTADLTNMFGNDFLGGNYLTSLEFHTNGNKDAFNGYVINFDSKLKTQIDAKTNKTLIDGLFNLNAVNGSINLSFKDISAQMLTSGNNIYVKEHNLPPYVSKLVFGSNDSNNQIDNQWFSINPSAFMNQSNPNIPSTDQNQKLNDFSKFYQESILNFKQYKLFQNTTSLGVVSVNGINTTHLTTNINLDELDRYLKMVAIKYVEFDQKQSEKNLNKSSITITNLNSQIDTLISQFRSNVIMNKLDFYLGNKDNKIYKYSVDATLNNVSQPLTQISGGNINFIQSFEIIDSNKSQQIQVPVKAQDITQSIKSLIGNIKTPSMTRLPSDMPILL